MSYVLYTFRFMTPVHFGSAEMGGKLERAGAVYTSDSLFSAICQELAQLGGTSDIEMFYDKVKNERILFSDLLPYCIGDNEEYAFYMPKPVLLIHPDAEHPAADMETARKEATLRKKQKKMKYIRAGEMKKYLQTMKEGKPYISPMPLELGEPELMERVNCRGDEPLPYYVGTYTFAPNAGLYVVAYCRDDADQEWLGYVLTSLGRTGIGGKRSSGLGKFEFSNDPLELDRNGRYGDDGALCAMLEDTGALYHMCLSSILPETAELGTVVAGQYTVRRRSGFVAGSDGNKKRDSVYMLCAGSCFTERLQGCITVTGETMGHPVWRSGKGLFVGLHI